ncbi:Acg family FMN-binding oxidoreductase [Nocardia stercoris]|uniref:NAD(P)H nitroreductase n=1 Tax=Nocardia stercoris TaxID=2483361 RepID=A0A3M2L8J0_9NOCA|nr:hypothetical protein [Nocardia stercoris]RMI33714.1 hypothetical protein EBN03_10590 [Nocardia stercoris]
MATVEQTSRSAAPDRRTLWSVFRAATRAPSVHNTQPWRWVADGVRLDLFSDLDRLLPGTDPRGRQQMISCGAILHHVITASVAHGWAVATERFPDPGDPDHLARLTLRPAEGPVPDDTERTRAMDRRYSDRLAMLPLTDPRPVMARLRAAVLPFEQEFEVLDPAVRPRLASLSDRHTATRRDDPFYQQELSWWTGHSEGPDGISAQALASASEYGRTDVGRAFPPAQGSDRRPGLADQATLALISSYGDSPRQWLLAGEALSAVLLDCTVAGLSTCPLTHVTELDAERRMLAMLLPEAGALPQVLVRIGTAPEGEEPPPPTPRRPLTDVVEFRA